MLAAFAAFIASAAMLILSFFDSLPLKSALLSFRLFSIYAYAAAEAAAAAMTLQ